MKRLIYSVTILALAACLTPQSANAQAYEPFLGEIQTFAFNFCPTGWVKLDGALYSISQYETIFNLIGTTYGGDGISTFAVPTWGPIYTANGATLLPCILMQGGVFPSPS
jgi:microcystin-dependent protein